MKTNQRNIITHGDDSTGPNTKMEYTLLPPGAGRRPDSRKPSAGTTSVEVTNINKYKDFLPSPGEWELTRDNDLREGVHGAPPGNGYGNKY